MQGIKANEIHAVIGKIGNQGAQIAKIADAPVFLRTQAIELDIHAGGFAATFQAGRFKCLGRGADQEVTLAVGVAQGVITHGQGRQAHIARAHRQVNDFALFILQGHARGR